MSNYGWILVIFVIVDIFILHHQVTSLTNTLVYVKKLAKTQLYFGLNR